MGGFISSGPIKLYIASATHCRYEILPLNEKHPIGWTLGLLLDLFQPHTSRTIKATIGHSKGNGWVIESTIVGTRPVGSVESGVEGIGRNI